MNLSFLQSPEYQEFKAILKDELQNTPLKLKTEGKTNETIAREVTAHEIAAKLVEKSLKRFERLATNTTTSEPQVYR